jgi:hypothetical protein
MLNATSTSPSSPLAPDTGSTDASDHQRQQPQQHQYQYPQVHQQQRLRPQQSEPSLTTSYTGSTSLTTSTHPQSHSMSHSHSLSHPNAHSLSQLNIRPALRVNLHDPTEHTSRRQRRRLDLDLDDENSPYQTPLHSEYTYPSTPAHLTSTSRSVSPSRARYNDPYAHPHSVTSSLPCSSLRRLSVSSTDSLSSADGDGDLTGAIGQLSLNEEEQVRYHGKASGLHLLGVNERVDGRNEGGIWFVSFPFPLASGELMNEWCRRFPKARVWPMVPSGTGSGLGHTKDEEDELAVAQLPEAAVQEELLELYFTSVHPCFPVVHKRAFFDSIKNRQVALPLSVLFIINSPCI